MRNGPFIMALLIVVACFGCASLPPDVQDEVLAGKTEEQSKSIERLERAVIEKKKRKDEAHRERTLAAHNVDAATDAIAALRQTGTRLRNDLKRASTENDAAKTASARFAIDANASEAERAMKNLDYAKAMREDADAIFAVRESELAVAVAELRTEKARIARKRQIKQLPEEKREAAAKKKGCLESVQGVFGAADDGVIDTAPYETFLQKQREQLEKTRSYQQKTAERLQKIKTDFERSRGGERK